MRVKVKVQPGLSQVAVSASRAVVAAWLDEWPCAELQPRRVVAYFSVLHGEIDGIIDHNVPEAEDGAALAALLEDMEDCAEEELRRL